MGVRPRPVGPGGAAAAAALASFHGWLVLHKPAGLPTRALSNVVLALLRRGTRVGHVGTLDPAAAGVVVLALGRAAKLAPYLDGTKAYAAVVKLGLGTATDDATGDARETAPCGGDAAPLRATVADALAARFMGAFPQVPPAVSAVKTGGRRAYRVALEGMRAQAAAVEAAVAADNDDSDQPQPPVLSLAPKMVTVHSLTVDGWCIDAVRAGSGWPHARTWVKAPATSVSDGRSAVTAFSSSSVSQRVGVRVETLHAAAPAPAALVAAADRGSIGSTVHCPFPEVRLSLSVGAGFYVRSLARDLGAAVGVPATLAALTRTRSGGFTLDDATPLYDLTRSTVLTPPALRPSDAPFVAALPGVVLAPVRRAAPRLAPDDHRDLVAAAAALRDVCAAGAAGATGGASSSSRNGDNNMDAAAQCSSSNEDDTPAPCFPLMPSLEALQTAVHLWNSDTQIVYEGALLPGVGAATRPSHSDSSALVAAAAAPYLVRVYALARHRDARAVLGGAVVMDVGCTAAKTAAAAAAAVLTVEEASAGAVPPAAEAARPPPPTSRGSTPSSSASPTPQSHHHHGDTTEAWWSRAADVDIDAASLAGASATAPAVAPAAGDDVVPVFAGLALALPPGAVPSLGAPDRRPRPGAVHLMRVVTMLV